jgi:hypothetical protein
MTTTILCLTASNEHEPFMVGSDVEARQLGYYTTLEAALSWLHADRERFEADAEAQADASEERLLFYEVREYALDTGPAEYLSRVGISTSGDVVRRVESGEHDVPWEGRTLRPPHERSGDCLSAKGGADRGWRGRGRDMEGTASAPAHSRDREPSHRSAGNVG